MSGRIASILLFVLFSFWISGCGEKQPVPVTRPCKNVQPPKWINDPFVGVSRITASGNKNDQRKIALQRAIVDLLMTKGNASGSSIVSMEKNLVVENKDERLQKHFQENSEMSVTYEKLHYNIRVTDIWRDPCTKELYVKIEEK
jgi:hypothetical protein